MWRKGGALYFLVSSYMRGAGRPENLGGKPPNPRPSRRYASLREAPGLRPTIKPSSWPLRGGPVGPSTGRRDGRKTVGLCPTPPARREAGRPGIWPLRGQTPARRCRERIAGLRASSSGPRPVPPVRSVGPLPIRAGGLRPPVRHLTRYGPRRRFRLLWSGERPQLRVLPGRFAIEREGLLLQCLGEFRLHLLHERLEHRPHDLLHVVLAEDFLQALAGLAGCI